MTISFSPGGASWPSAGFHELRKTLAVWEGIYDLETWWKNPLRGEENPTPLFPLLDAEDVHGFLSGPTCKSMLPRLREVLRVYDLSHYDRSNLEALVEGMEHCAEHGCALSWG